MVMRWKRTIFFPVNHWKEVFTFWNWNWIEMTYFLLFSGCKYPKTGRGSSARPTTATWIWFNLINMVLGQSKLPHSPMRYKGLLQWWYWRSKRRRKRRFVLEKLFWIMWVVITQLCQKLRGLSFTHTVEIGLTSTTDGSGGGGWGGRRPLGAPEKEEKEHWRWTPQPPPSEGEHPFKAGGWGEERKGA